MIAHLLQKLNEYNHPAELGDYIIQNVPADGIGIFQSLLEEMEGNKWLIKRKEDVGFVTGLQQLRKQRVTFSMRIQETEHLSSLKLIEDFYQQNIEYKNLKNDLQPINQSLDTSADPAKINSVEHTNSTEEKSDSLPTKRWNKINDLVAGIVKNLKAQRNYIKGRLQSIKDFFF